MRHGEGMSTPTVHVAGPGEPAPEAYYATRYAVLREPLGRPRGSERLLDDATALHVWIEVDGVVVAVARGHLITGDGAAADHAGPEAAKIPAFAPLAKDDTSLRPAVQVRQMGVLEAWRGQGFGALALEHLVRACVQTWNARTGWLQAREGAIEFYAREGWVAFDPPYSIAGVGPHRSMWRRLDKLFD